MAGSTRLMSVKDGAVDEHPNRYRVTVVSQFFVDIEPDPHAQLPRYNRAFVKSAVRSYIWGLITILKGQRIRTDIFVVKERRPRVARPAESAVAQTSTTTDKDNGNA